MTDPDASNVVSLPRTSDWPAPPRPAAFTGLAGEITRAIEPHSESDPLAVLTQLLVCFGSVIGRGTHYAVDATNHHGNEFLLLVGPTAKGRKGTAWDHVQRLFAEVDPEWATQRIVSGLSSGEGLIWRVRDPDNGARGRGEPEQTDEREREQRGTERGHGGRCRRHTAPAGGHGARNPAAVSTRRPAGDRTWATKARAPASFGARLTAAIG